MILIVGLVDRPSLDVVAEAFRTRGYEAVAKPAFRRRPRMWAPAVWVRLPGNETYAVVFMADLVPGSKVGSWTLVAGASPGETVTGYELSLRGAVTCPQRRRYGLQAEWFFTVFADEVVAKAGEWAGWERTWSVTPQAEPEARRLRRLRRLASSKLASTDITVDVEIDPLMLALLTTAQVESLHAVIDDLFLPAIRWRFPRDRTGTKLVSRARVLLCECAPPKHPSRQGIWLVLDGPQPRGPAQVTARLARASGRSEAHRWNRLPEYWRTGARTVEELWGIEGGVSATMVDEIVDLLHAGQMAEALDRAGVEVETGARRLLTGLPEQYESRRLTETWVMRAAAAMAAAAPWRWHDAVTLPRRQHRLASLGGINVIRRPGLFLELANQRPVLSFERSGTPLVASQQMWRRDADYDLVRAGLIRREQIPMAHIPSTRLAAVFTTSGWPPGG